MKRNLSHSDIFKLYPAQGIVKMISRFRKKNPAQALQVGVKCLFVSLNIHGTLELKKNLAAKLSDRMTEMSEAGFKQQAPSRAAMRFVNESHIEL